MVRVIHARFVSGRCDAPKESFTGLVTKVTCEVCLLRLITQQLEGVEIHDENGNVKQEVR